jgi:hypothetical protein
MSGSNRRLLCFNSSAKLRVALSQLHADVCRVFDTHGFSRFIDVPVTLASRPTFSPGSVMTRRFGDIR